MCGNGTADCSLPSAKPGGTARGEFQKPEEEKGGVRDRKTRGRSVLSQHRAVPRLTEGRSSKKTASGSFLEMKVLRGFARVT